MSIVKAFSLGFAPRSIAIVELTSVLYALVASKRGTVIVNQHSNGRFPQTISGRHNSMA
jgi:hypothetical protein